MSDLMKMLSTFVDATALIMALVLVVSIWHRQGKTGWKHSVLMGTMFSIALVFTMSDPINLGQAGIFDMRGLLIGTAAALFGPIVGLMTLVTGLFMRWNIGGPGMVPGFVGMFFAYGAGLIWMVTVKRFKMPTWQKSVVLGFMITTQMTAIFFTPVEMWGPLIFSLGPYTVASNVGLRRSMTHMVMRRVTMCLNSSHTRSGKICAPVTCSPDWAGMNSRSCCATLTPKRHSASRNAAAMSSVRGK